MLLAAIGLSSPQAANGGGPKGQALQTGGGEQTIEPPMGNSARVSGASRWRELFAIYDAIGIGERGGRKLARLRGFALENADFEIFCSAK